MKREFCELACDQDRVYNDSWCALKETAPFSATFGRVVSLILYFYVFNLISLTTNFPSRLEKSTLVKTSFKRKCRSLEGNFEFLVPSRNNPCCGSIFPGVCVAASW